MKASHAASIGTLSVLAVVIGANYLLRSHPLVAESASASADDVIDTITVNGVIRDFKSEHSDFDVYPDLGIGHYAGNVSEQLGADGKPRFRGEIGTTVTEFTITDSIITPTTPFAAMFTVVGSAIQSGGVDMPVTMKAIIGSDEYQPFGSFDLALAGNVNDDQNPRQFIPTTVYPGGTPIVIAGRSWTMLPGADENTEESWTESLGYSTLEDTPQIKVLRHGDPVPEIPGFEDQDAIEEYIADFVDLDTNTVSLLNNQVIVLFEVGTIDLGEAAADFQDLVVLVTLATDPGYLEELDSYGHTDVNTNLVGGFKVDSAWHDAEGREIAPHLETQGSSDACGAPLLDIAGTAGGESFGGITSETTFSDWYNNVLGVNMSKAHAITLVKVDDVYEYIDDEFYPADASLFGNEGEDHNYHFTYAITLSFVYDQCEDQFVEFQGGDGAWAFINSELVMDIGGVATGSKQYISVDRLGLTDGEHYTMRLFHAQRRETGSTFRLRTNIVPVANDTPITVTAQYD